MWLKKLSNHRNPIPNLIIILILLGIFFRFYNLDVKVYWYDETMTSLRLSGHTQTETINNIFNQGVITVKELLAQYQYPNPAKTINDTLNALAGNPEHSPLYYLMARLWLQVFPDSVFTIRLLSALISLLVFPSIYWLCWELFRKEDNQTKPPNPSLSPHLISWIAVILIAISPFHVLYGQEAREYSLWTVTILFSGAAFLRAMRVKSWASWGIYGISVGLGLYVHPFSAFVLVGHGIYLLIKIFLKRRGTQREGGRYGKEFWGYLISAFLGVILFVPWLVIVVSHFSKFVANTASVSMSREGFLPLFWGLNLSRIFVDVNQGSSPFSPLHYLSAWLAIYSLYYLYRQGSLRVWLFIITLIGVTGMALIGPDLILGGRRSSITRYAIPCYLGIEIAVSYLIASKINMPNGKRWRYLAIALAFSGIISCAVSSQFPVWWHKSRSKSAYNPQVATILNQSDRSLVISDEIPGIVLSLSHLLNPDVHWQLLLKPTIPEITGDFSNVFLYRPSPELQQGLAAQPNLKLVPESLTKSWLWRVDFVRPNSANL